MEFKGYWRKLNSIGGFGILVFQQSLAILAQRVTFLNSGIQMMKLKIKRISPGLKI